MPYSQPSVGDELVVGVKGVTQVMLFSDFKRLTSSLIVAGMLTLVATLPAQERESLSEPVFRVVNTNSQTVSDSVRPELDRTLFTKTAGLPAAAQPVAVTQPPALPQIPGKHPALLAAVNDANACLDHIQKNVKGYECILRRREKVKGVVLPVEFIRAKIRQQQVVDGKVTVPFSVYLKFLKPDDVKGREILYIENQNNNKILVKEGGGGFKARLPSMWLALNNSLVMKSCRYPVSDAGIENLTRKLIDRGTKNDGNISMVDYTASYTPGATINKCKCNYLSVDFLTRNDVNEASKIEIFIDSERNFPIRYVAYDWPKNGSPDILEEYTYLNLAVTNKLTDADFDPENPNYNF